MNWSSMSPREMNTDFIADAASKVNTGLYGPRFCTNCKAVQPVITYKLEGSDYLRFEGLKCIAGFTGSHVCSVCYRPIADST